MFHGEYMRLYRHEKWFRLGFSPHTAQSMKTVFPETPLRSNLLIYRVTVYVWWYSTMKTGIKIRD